MDESVSCTEFCCLTYDLLQWSGFLYGLGWRVLRRVYKVNNVENFSSDLLYKSLSSLL